MLRNEETNASLGQVSKKYTLNERQDIAFRDSFLLDSFKRSIQNSDDRNPLRMHIHVEAGTRMSRIIEALIFLSNAWGRPEAICTIAPAGIAAGLFKEKLYCLSFYSVQNVYQKRSEEEIELCSSVLCWCEMSISMLGQSIFTELLRNSKISFVLEWRQILEYKC